MSMLKYGSFQERAYEGKKVKLTGAQEVKGHDPVGLFGMG